MSRRFLFGCLGALVIACLLGVGVYFLPPVHERLAWRVNSLRIDLLRRLTPAEKVTFLPQQAPTGAAPLAQPTWTPTVSPLAVPN